MERAHPRDIRAPAIRAAAAAAAMDTTANAQQAGGLLKRGARITKALLFSRRCTTSETLDTCEKPTASTNTVLGILVGVGVLIFLIVLAVLYFLHLRRKRFDKAEMENDPHELSDYGLDEIPVVKKGGKKEAAKSKTNLDIPDLKQHRLSAQELLEAQNPFGNGAELADSDKMPSSKSGSPKSGSPKSGSPPPQYPGEAHKKM